MLRVVLASAAIAASVGPAAAHHSLSMYDRSADKTITGTVKDYKFENPHVWIYLIVVKDDATTEEWGFEGPGPGRLSGRGWSPTTFKTGDKLTVSFNPKRDGSPGGLFQDITDEQGTQYSGGFGGGRFGPPGSNRF